MITTKTVSEVRIERVSNGFVLSLETDTMEERFVFSSLRTTLKALKELLAEKTYSSGQM